MSLVRQATPEDGPEVLRLRQVMIDSALSRDGAAAHGAPGHGDGTRGDGTRGDGTRGDGTHGDGTRGDGTRGDGTRGDAVPAGSSTDWHALALPTLRERLAGSDGDFVAFVVDHPDRPGALAALAVGEIEYRIGNARNPRGRIGFVHSVATDPDARRRGYARACMEALLGWFRERGAGAADLNASMEGEPLYESLGFVRKPDPSMRLTF
jgi:GNAT superfamily N-acetyltransferase